MEASCVIWWLAPLAKIKRDALYLCKPLGVVRGHQCISTDIYIYIYIYIYYNIILIRTESTRAQR